MNWVWRFYWEASVLRSLSAATWPPAEQNGDPKARAPQPLVYYDAARRRLLHCHPDGGGGFSRPDTNLIAGGWGNRAICPSWMMSPGDPPWDERRGIDAEIRPELLPGLRMARARLLRLLDRAAASDPANDWVAGARVRFALDQGDTVRALAAAAACRAQPGWCHALHAYVLGGEGETGPADSEFTVAVELLPGGERCEWTDLSVLLGPGSGAYAGTPCADRGPVNERIWWLSQPLYVERGNERRVEHYARMVTIRLRSGDRPAERWDWSEGDGGRAVREMIIRYGWPAFSYWLGHAEDEEHYHYLGVGVVPLMKHKDSVTMDAGIFATAEYPVNRYHLVPDWAAVADPWHAAATDWAVWTPPRFNADSVNIGVWPREHAPHAAGPLVQFATEQAGAFRRDAGVALSVATDPSPDVMGRAAGDTVDGVLVVSPAPDSFEFHRARSVVGTISVLQALIPSVPAIIGVELTGEPGQAAARVRFGLVPPKPLSGMAAGEIAISDPVFIRTAPTGVAPPSDPAIAIPLMLPSTALRAGRLGIYWETYGVGVGDTVDLSVRVARRGGETVLERMVGALRVFGSRPNGFAVTWREPARGHTTTTIVASHPIQGHGITVDVAGLDPGEYTLEVAVARPGGRPVRSSRPFTILAK